MITIRIGNKKYKGIYSWDDISIKQFSTLAAVSIPEKYRDYELADGSYDPDKPDSVVTYANIIENLTSKDLSDVFPDYYRSVICVLTNIPESVINTLSVDRITEIYEHVKPFVLSLIYHAPVTYNMGVIEPYEAPMLKSFRVGMNKFYFPKSLHVNGQDYPLFSETAGAYTEASDTLGTMTFNKDDIKRFAQFMAIYCRKRKERYSDNIVLKREKIFLNVPMSIVWSVFFYTLKQVPFYTSVTQLFGNRQRSLQEVVSQTHKSLVTAE